MTCYCQRIRRRTTDCQPWKSTWIYMPNSGNLIVSPSYQFFMGTKILKKDGEKEDTSLLEWPEKSGRANSKPVLSIGPWRHGVWSSPNCRDAQIGSPDSKPVVVGYLRSFWANLNRLFYPSSLVFLISKKGELDYVSSEILFQKSLQLAA